MISIIVPIYNAEKYIVDTIKMVLKQTYCDWELLLIDDCSVDESLTKVNDFLAKANASVRARIKVIKHEKNCGAALARNTGLDKAEGRYIAFLDADDIWFADKLEKQFKFMLKTGAAFTFTAYEFGDNFANGTGKIVSVPLTLTYRKALSRTIIFTSTTLFDLNKIDKDYLKMPNVVSEDTATWWKILRNGYTAYGMNVVTTIYRRPAGSLSSNKIKAIKRIWYLYRKVEKLSIFSSTYNFLFWAVRATKRRLV